MNVQKSLEDIRIKTVTRYSIRVEGISYRWIMHSWSCVMPSRHAGDVQDHEAQVHNIPRSNSAMNDGNNAPPLPSAHIYWTKLELKDVTMQQSPHSCWWVHAVHKMYYNRFSPVSSSFQCFRFIIASSSLALILLTQKNSQMLLTSWHDIHCPFTASLRPWFDIRVRCDALTLKCNAFKLASFLETRDAWCISNCWLTSLITGTFIVWKDGRRFVR